MRSNLDHFVESHRILANFAVGLRENGSNVKHDEILQACMAIYMVGKVRGWCVVRRVMMMISVILVIFGKFEVYFYVRLRLF